MTTERIAQALTRLDYRYLRDEQGELCGLWGYRLFTFTLVHERLLLVRGRWARQGGIPRRTDLLEFANRWNATNVRPKCYLRVGDDGRVHVLAETALPVTAGLSDAQLDNHLSLSLSSGSLVFDSLDEHFPDPILADEA